MSPHRPHPAAPTSGPAAASSSADWDAAWGDALSALELDLDLAERMLALGHLAQDPPDPWAPPVGLGPMPLALVDRARTLLDRQIAVARQVAEAADLSRRHSRAVQAMRTQPPSSPVYVDTPA